jgi:tyrosine-protein phosphatase YwqE
MLSYLIDKGCQLWQSLKTGHLVGAIVKTVKIIASKLSKNRLTGFVSFGSFLPDIR